MARYGKNLVKNHNFSTGHNYWQQAGAGWSIDGATASRTAQGSVTWLYQQLALKASKKIRVKYTINSISGGNVYLRLSDDGAASTNPINSTTQTVAGTYTEELTVGANSAYVHIRAGTSTVVDIDNISIQELLPNTHYGKKHFLFNWSELDDYNTILDKEWNWLHLETGLDKQMHDLRYAWLKSQGDYNSFWDFFADQPGGGKETDWYEDAASLSFQALGPRLDGTVDTAPQRGTGSATFTRDDSANNGIYVRDFENNQRKVADGEARIQGARRVENQSLDSEDFTELNGGSSAGNTPTATTVEFTIATSYRYKRITGSYKAGTTLTFSAEISSEDKSQVGFRVVGLTSASSNDTIISVTPSIIPTRYNVTVTLVNDQTNIEIGLDNRVGFGGDDSTTGTVTITNFQLEDVSGQSNQAPSEYVATEGSAVTKYFWKENLNEVAENGIDYSYDITQWGPVNSPTSALDEVGVDGVANKATTVTDSNAAGLANYYRDGTVTDDSEWNNMAFYIKKSDDETIFPAFLFTIQDGTAVQQTAVLNKKTGDINVVNTAGTVEAEVEDNGSWWKLILKNQNNGTGNVTARVRVYPAYSDDFATSDVALTGSCVIGHTQLETGVSTSSETRVETTGTAITNVVGTKTKQYEQTANVWEQSLNVDTISSTVVSPAPTFFEGEREQIVEDNSAGSPLTLTDSYAVSDDNAWHTSRFIIRKGRSEGALGYPALVITLGGGTTQNCVIGMDPDDITSYTVSGTGNYFGYVREYDANRIEIVLSVQNNSSGNTTVTGFFYPSYYLTKWGYSATSVGAITISHLQMNENRVLPYEEVVHTDGSAITLGKEVDLETDLHPTGYSLGAKRFNRYDKWIASTAYSVGDIIIPDTGSGPSGGNGYYYTCVVAGTSDSSEPTFSTTVGEGTYDNGVVWKCMGKATVAGYLVEPACTNEITDSYDLTAWTQTGTAVSALDETGIDGIENKATTLTDDDGASTENVNTTVTIPNDSNTHTTYIKIKKDSDTSRYVGFQIYISGGTAIREYIHIDTQNGTGVEEGAFTDGDFFIEDHGEWWKVVLTLANNTTGNTSCFIGIAPSRGGAVQGTPDSTATGSCIVGHAQLELNTAIPSSPIETTGTAETRAIDVLDYPDDDASSNDGTVLMDIGEPSRTASVSHTINLLHDTAGSWAILYSQSGRIQSYDGTTVAQSTPNVLDHVQETPSMGRGGGRYNATDLTQETAVNGNSGTEVAYDPQSGTGLRVCLNAGFPITVADILLFNKDLDTTKLESMTEYD